MKFTGEPGNHGTYVGLSPGRGRGIFAKKDFKKGDVVEVSPVIVLDENDSEVLQDTLITYYVYAWGGDKTCLALGNGSLFNHSEKPNVGYHMMENCGQIMYTAKKKISKGEELFVCYTPAGEQIKFQGDTWDFDGQEQTKEEKGDVVLTAEWDYEHFCKSVGYWERLRRKERMTYKDFGIFLCWLAENGAPDVHGYRDLAKKMEEYDRKHKKPKGRKNLTLDVTLFG